jgi:predicted dehydrogenase
MKTIRWAILGAGKIAAKFASDFKAVPNCELVAVGSNSKERAEAFAAEWQIPHAYGSYEGIFEQNLDVVYVASWHPSHKNLTLLCIKNKVAVLCEKPFGMNAPEVQEMIDAAKKENIFLMEALWSRFHPTFIQAKNWLDAGIIGKPICFHADFGFKADYDENSRLFDPAKGGSAILDIGIYPAFFAYSLLGLPLEILSKKQLSPTGTDHTASYIFAHENGVNSILSCTFSATTNCEAILYGDKGKITIHSRFHEATEVSYELHDGTYKLEKFPRETFGYDYEIDHVNTCLRAGKIESELMSHQNSQDLIKILDTLMQD